MQKRPRSTWSFLLANDGVGVCLPIERCPQGGLVYRQIVTRSWGVRKGRGERGGMRFVCGFASAQRGYGEVVKEFRFEEFSEGHNTYCNHFLGLLHRLDKTEILLYICNKIHNVQITR
jgi:hypothetical protein